MIAKALRERGADPQQVAHFLTQCIFCMFAEDEGIIHSGHTENSGIFTTLLKASRNDPAKAAKHIRPFPQAKIPKMSKIKRPFQPYKKPR